MAAKTRAAQTQAYEPTVWKDGDLITAEKLNKLEEGVQNQQTGPAGADGKDGAAAGFGTPTATVDNNTGTPEVTVTVSGPDTAKVFAFAFKNLKGEPGENGQDGVGLTGEAAAVAAIETPESADTATVANKINEVITQLKARGVVL